MITKTYRSGLRGLFTALLVLTLIFTALAVTVGAADEKQASVTVGETVTEYATLAEAVAAAEAGSTVKLLSDVELETAITVEKDITLDLAGFTLEAKSKSENTVLTVAAALTVADSSEGEDGEVDGTIAVSTGTLSLTGGTFKRGLDLGTALISSAISEALCVKVSGVPTAVAADATKIDGKFQVTAHTYEYVSDADTHKEVCKCGYEKPDSTVAHTGGTATCTALAKCELCEAEYGAFADHTYADAYDSTYHFEECTVCEDRINREAHTGGTATCSEQAKCTVCNHGYGATLAHTPSGNLVDGSDSLHWYVCSVCGGQASVSAHIYPSDWTVITEPTHDAEGLRERACACGHKITSAIPVLEAGEFPVVAIVFIVIGCVLVAAFAIFAIIWFGVKKKSFADLKAVFSKKAPEAEEADSAEAVEDTEEKTE